jgi:iron(III) transport system substrate-binding protein
VKHAWGAIALASWLALAGCGQAPAANSSSQQAKPAASGAQEWESTVATAKREGKVVVMSFPGDPVRAVLVEPFQNQFGIPVDYTALAGTAITPRIQLERNSGQFNWDIFIGGAAVALEGLIPMGALDPIEPSLILPEVKDGKNWRGGALPLFGPKREALIMTPYQRGTLFYNKNVYKGDEIKSYKDLLDPKWKDKMQMDDPRRPGPGQATFIFFYLHPDLGPDFIRALLKQNITIQADFQQEIDMVGQGRAPFMIGAVDSLAEARMKQGAPIGIFDPTNIKEGSDISAASGNVGVFNRPAHPNAAKVYVNWLLTRETQEAYAKANVFTSARADVSGDWTEPWRVPAPNGIRTDGEVAVEVRPKLLPILREALGSG